MEKKRQATATTQRSKPELKERPDSRDVAEDATRRAQRAVRRTLGGRRRKRERREERYLDLGRDGALESRRGTREGKGMDVLGGIRILSLGELKPEAVEVETWIPPLVPQDRADLERPMGQLRVWADGLKRPSQHQASSELDSESEQPYLFPTPLLAHPLTKSFSSAPPQPGAPLDRDPGTPCTSAAPPSFSSSVVLVSLAFFPLVLGKDPVACFGRLLFVLRWISALPRALYHFFIFSSCLWRICFTFDLLRAVVLVSI